MEHINEYEDGDIDSLLGDLIDLGIAEPRVSIKIFDKRAIIKTLSVNPYIIITFPLLDKKIGIIDFKDILDSFNRSNFIISRGSDINLIEVNQKIKNLEKRISIMGPSLFIPSGIADHILLHRFLNRLLGTSGLYRGIAELKMDNEIKFKFEIN